MSWHYGHDRCGGNSSVARVGCFGGQGAREDAGYCTKGSRQQHADVVEKHPVETIRDAHRIGQRRHNRSIHCFHGLVNRHRGNLHSRVDRRTHGAADRVPRHVVVPGTELRPAILREILGCTVVEPGVELVNHTAIVFHRVKPNIDSCVADRRQGSQLDEKHRGRTQEANRFYH